MASMQSQPHNRPPAYWMYETSGKLEPVVRAFLNNERLTETQITIMRAYLWQWLSAPVWAWCGELDTLLRRVSEAKTQEQLSRCISAAEELGMDPL